MRTRGPDHEVDDVAGLLDDVVARARAVEIPERFPRQVPAIAVGLQEQHLSDAAFLDELHRGGAIRIMSQLEARLKDPLSCARGIDYLTAILGRDSHRLFAIHTLADLERSNGHLLVEVDWRRDHHRIDIFPVEQLPIFAITI